MSIDGPSPARLLPVHRVRLPQRPGEVGGGGTGGGSPLISILTTLCDLAFPHPAAAETLRAVGGLLGHQIQVLVDGQGERTGPARGGHGLHARHRVMTCSINPT